MKSILVVAGMVMMLIATGQTAAAQGQPEKALQDAADARLKAMSSADAEGWGKYTTDDFIVIEADGTQKTKTQRMTEIKGTPSAATQPTDQKWRTYGTDTAVSTAMVTIDGKPTRVTSVWVKQGDAWKVASVQLTTVAAPK